MTATQIVTNKLALKCCGVFSAYSKIETMCKWLCFNSKKASNAVSNCQLICKCPFSTKIGTGKLGRISTENQSQTSNREGSRATH
jgi:hypothetical protein